MESELSSKNPGLLYGMAGDCWAALAVGVAYREREHDWRWREYADRMEEAS